MSIADNVTILASGGIDSTACLHFYKKLGFKIDVLFVNYGQKALKMELRAISAITAYYQVPLRIITIQHHTHHQHAEIKGRNGAFLLIALMQFENTNGLICLGVHAGTNYFDCSKSFIEKMQSIFTGYTNNTIQISTPFLNFNKREIFEYCLHESVPLHLTYSCETGEEEPCGTCLTCKDLQELYAL